MAKRITRIEPWQTAKTLAAVAFVLGLIVAVLLALVPTSVFEAAGEPAPSRAVFFAVPFAYLIGALIFVPIWCWVYNLVAARTGGIEINVTDTSR
jgi:hypothetical protein